MSDPSSRHPRVVLCILDGVGYRTGPGSEIGNAVIGSEPAFYNSLFERYPHTALEACGRDVGLPDGQMGNSEVGHLTIGAGRVVNQELARIGQSIDDGEFATLETWRKFVDRAKEGTGRLHLLGLVSPGGTPDQHLWSPCDSGACGSAVDLGPGALFCCRWAQVGAKSGNQRRGIQGAGGRRVRRGRGG